MNMPLYTFIMEYAGGTYISQVEASSPKKACVEWLLNLNPRMVSGLGKKGKMLLVEKMAQAEPTPVNEVLNTWCISANVSGEMVLVNLVRTAVTTE
jgi:hypothetical protein